MVRIGPRRVRCGTDAATEGSMRKLRSCMPPCGCSTMMGASTVGAETGASMLSLRALTEPSAPSFAGSNWLIPQLTHMMARGPNDPVAILVLASMFRDEIPWLYELGMEEYRVAKNGSHEALERLQHALHLTRRGPFMKGVRPLHRDVPHVGPPA